VAQDKTDDGSRGDARPPSTREQYDLNLKVLVALPLPGLVLAGIVTLVASFTICGVSGCSGGGFGRSTDPATTLALLVAAGILSAAPLGVYAVLRKSLRVALVAVLLAILVSIAAGWLIGSDFRGCPRNVDTATCLEESS
jgi:EamA domain-containing membrane protein RarD